MFDSIRVPGSYRSQWAFYFLVLESVLSLVWVTWLGARGHYFNYTEPAKLLWQHIDPYGRDLVGSPGHFFYSPGCALYYFGFFALFSPRWGQLLYIGSATLLFFVGLLRWSKIVAPEFDLWHSPFRHLLFFMLGSELVGAIGAVKIEPLFVGSLFLLLSFQQQRKIFLVGLLAMGVISSWKLHPLAIVTLILIPSFLRLDFMPMVIFLVGVGLGFLSPYLALPPAFATEVTGHWLGELNRYMTAEWRDRIFQHLPGFLSGTVGWPWQASTTNAIGFGCGVAFAAIYTFWFVRVRPTVFAASTVALGFGSAHVVLFSLLMQSNSYAIYTPLPLAIAWLSSRNGRSKKPTLFVLFITFFAISIAYSDLTPRDLRNWIYDFKIKPVGVLIQWLWLVLLMLRESIESRRGRDTH